jgi:hypothetical protein
VSMCHDKNRVLAISGPTGGHHALIILANF